VVRYRAANFMTRRVPTPIGEPDGRTTPRLERTVRAFRTAGINANRVADGCLAEDSRRVRGRAPA
jgi:hypothetical protein